MGIRHLCLIGILIAGPSASAEGVPPPHERIASEPNYTLTLELRDNAGAPIDARVSVLDPVSGICFGTADPTEPLYESWTGHRYFYARDRVEVVVPGGDVRLLVSKGPEYAFVDKVIKVVRDRTYKVELRRLIDATSYGWFSGDTHVHEAHGGEGATFTIDNLRMAKVARAEDLNLTCVLSNGPYFNGGIDPASDARHILHFGMEYRSALYGHMGLLGLNTLLSAGCCLPGYPAYPLNRTICEAAHAQGATVVSSHPLPMDPAWFMTAILSWPYSGLARELPVDALIGGIDAIDLFSYSNYSELAMRKLWFDLLNLGLRIPLSVGTDAGVNRVFDPPAGGYRVYVRPNGPFSLDSWLAGLRQGRSFATNGPLVLDFSLDRKGMGEVLKLPEGEGYHTLAGHLALFSREPMQQLEIFSNGLKIATHTLPKTTGWLYYDFALTIWSRPAWVVARVSGQTTAPTTVGHPEVALTSPIYLDAPGQRFEPNPQAVERFDEWIRDLQALVLQRGGWTDPGQMFGVWNDLETTRRGLYGRPGIDRDPPVVEQPLAPDGIAVTRVDRGTTHAFRAEGAGEARLEVFDVSGRLVRVSEAMHLPAIFTWDASGETGPAPAGLYFARVRGASGISPVQRVLVLR